MNFDYVGGWPMNPDLLVDADIQLPAQMLSDGSMIVHTPNQCDCFESPKSPQVIRSAFLTMDLDISVGDSLNKSVPIYIGD